MIDFLKNLESWQLIVLCVVAALVLISIVIYITERVKSSNKNELIDVELAVEKYDDAKAYITLNKILKKSKFFYAKFTGQIVESEFTGDTLVVNRDAIQKESYQVEFCDENGVVFARGYLNDLAVENVPAEPVLVEEPDVESIEEEPQHFEESEPETEVITTDEEAEDEEEVGEEYLDGKRIYVRYRKSFLAKLMQTTDENKNYYVELANYFVSHKKVKQRDSFACSTFNAGRNKLAKFTIKGKTLYVYLALDPKDYVDSKYFAVDVSEYKKYQDVPTLIKVKSDRGLKFAKELIDEVAKEKELEFVEPLATEFDVKQFPYKSKELLLKMDLIKTDVIEGTVDDDPTAFPKIQ